MNTIKQTNKEKIHHISEIRFNIQKYLTCNGSEHNYNYWWELNCNVEFHFKSQLRALVFLFPFRWENKRFKLGFINIWIKCLNILISYRTILNTSSKCPNMFTVKYHPVLININKWNNKILWKDNQNRTLTLMKLIKSLKNVNFFSLCKFNWERHSLNKNV